MTININSMIHLDCEVTGCVVEFYLNDIPIKLLDSNIQNFSSKVAHTFIRQGVNKLKVIVFPNKSPSIASNKYESDIEISDAMKVVANVVEYPVNAVPGTPNSGRLLGSLVLSHEKVAHTSSKSLPLISEESFNINSLPFPNWHWCQAEKINFEREAHLINLFVKKLHRYFGNGDGKAVAELALLQIADAGVAIPARGRKGMYEDLVDSINQVKENNEVAAPILDEETDFRICADGRLVQLINKDWRATIRTEEDATGYSYPYFCFIGKIESEFKILLSL